MLLLRTPNSPCSRSLVALLPRMRVHMRSRMLSIVIGIFVLQSALPRATLSESSEPAQEALSVLDRSDWDLYGSVLRLTKDGDSIRFVVVRPNHFLKLAGVSPGSVLVEAFIRGSSVEGTAYMFDRKCGSFLYQVRGSIDISSTRIVLKGNAPLIDWSCHVFGYRFDRLELAMSP